MNAIEKKIAMFDLLVVLAWSVKSEDVIDS